MSLSVVHCSPAGRLWRPLPSQLREVFVGLVLSIEPDQCVEVSLDDWRAAVAAVDGVDWDNDDRVTRNPATGQEIRIPAAPWQAQAGAAVLQWSPHSIRTTVPWHFSEDLEAPEFQGIMALAAALDARVVGNFEFEIRPDGSTAPLLDTCTPDPAAVSDTPPSPAREPDLDEATPGPPPAPTPSPAPAPKTWWEKLFGP